MGKIYSDEEMEMYSKNPKVLYISRRHLSLTLTFRKELYKAWLKDPFPSTIKKILIANGFDVDSIGKSLCKSLAWTFRHRGEPRYSYPPASNAGETKFGIAYEEEMQSQKKCSKDLPPSQDLEWYDEESKRMTKDDLIATGKFIPNGSGIWFSPAFEKELSDAYPETSIREGIKRAGFNLRAVGYHLAYKLERKLKAAEKETARNVPEPEAGTDRMGLPTDKEDELKKNPFVLGVENGRIQFRQEFFEAAAAIQDLPVEDILDVFLLDNTAISGQEKKVIAEKLGMTSPVPMQDMSLGGTCFEACVLLRRAAALTRLAEAGFEKIASEFPAMTPVQKKKLCQWVESFPKDPAHVYTKKFILRRIGITRSIYYRYIKDPDFGLGEERRNKADAEKAEAIRKVMEYKGFRKGSRQVYMLLPRLTGQSMSLKKIRRLMKEYGMKSGIREADLAGREIRKHMKETEKPNILKRRFRLHRPNEVRVTDVTYLDYGCGSRAYGSALMDPVTGRLLAFVISEHNDLEMALETLRAGDSHPCEDGGIFHSDQGTLYRTCEFQKELLDRGYTQSMSKKGNCWDNATQESFFGHFKDECDYASCKDIRELKKMVDQYEYYYNNERGLWDRGRMTPAGYESYLLSLDEEEFARYLRREEEKYQEMKKRAAELAKKRYGTLGV